MLDIHKVLFATDFSDVAESAFPWAVRFASVHGAELHLLHAIALYDADPAIPLKHYRVLEAIYERMVQHAQEQMRSAVAESEASELPVEIVVRRGISPADAILDYALQEDIDLIVVGTHGQRGLRPQLLGSVCSEVARIAHCPVLAVGRDKPVEVERIVVPLDFSEPSDVGLEHARHLGASFGATLSLLHVVEVECYQEVYFSTPIEEAFDLPALEEKAAQLLEERMVTGNGPEVSFEVATVAAHPVEGILDFAEDRNADLLVLASHGRTGHQPALVGSVANSVLRRAPCPLLVVKAFGKSLRP
ncbi:MAG: universal stress protein [Gemmatimonadales bacterium]